MKPPTASPPVGPRALAGALFVCAISCAAARPVRAHEFWIAPSRYEAAAAGTVELSAAAGTGFRGESKPWSPDRAVRFVLRTSRTLDLRRAATPGENVWTRFRPSDPGGAMAGFESTFLGLELPAAQFDAYLKEEGLDGPLAWRRARAVASPGRERYRRCAKSWLAGNAPERALAPLGLALELVPETVPGEGETLRLRVLEAGRPLPGVLLKAWCRPLQSGGAPLATAERDSLGPAWSGRSDARGAVAIPVRESGEWLVSAVHMVESRDRAQADWESTWASLTFARPGAAEPVGGGRARATSPGASSPAARGTAAPRGASPSAGGP